MTTPQFPPVVEGLSFSRRLRASALYLFFFAALAAILPYVALYYRSLGFSGTQMGLLLSLGPLVGLFATPFWTGIADTRSRHLLVLLVAMGGSAALYAAFPFLQTFGLILTAVIMVAFVAAPMFALIDSSTLHMLGAQKERYGRIRLWGTVGWGLSAPIVGEVLERNGLEWMFWLYALLMVAAIFLVRGAKFEQNKGATPFWPGLRSILVNRKWVLLLLATIAMTIGLVAHGNFLSLLMDDLGASRTLLGITITLSTIFELPVMALSDRLLKRFGARGLLVLAMGLTALRCLLYGVTTSPGQILVIQVMHGFTYPALWIAGVHFAAKHAPPGLQATAQGLFGSVQGGLGTALGNFLCGALIDQVGLRSMFTVTGGFVLLCMFVLLGMRARRPSGRFT